jgi:5'-deoxynucleotidase YfbR-like HD superfamily hydrolase
VRRFHTCQIIGEHTVAEHCAQAATLLLLLHPGPSVDLIAAVLWHDSSERVVGDVPSPTLRRFPKLGDAYVAAEYGVASNDHPSVGAVLAKLSPEDLWWLRAVDALEGLMFCCDQVNLGNRNLAPVRDKYLSWLRSPGSVTPDPVLKFLTHYMGQEGGPKGHIPL